MGKDTVKLYSDINRYLDKPIVEKKKTEETLPPLFENKQDIKVNPEEVAIQESQEKIAELEQKLAELKDKYENGNKNKAFTGGTAGLFAYTAILSNLCEEKISIVEVPKIILKLEKFCRRVKKPAVTNLLALGITATSLALTVGLSALTFVTIGKLNDKSLHQNTEQELEEEKAKLASLQQALA